MDDKFDTQISVAIATTVDDSERDTALTRYLIVLSGGIQGAMVPLSLGLLQIGRSEENGLALPDPSISRRHASIRLTETGEAWLTDQRSTNGTYHNGLKLTPGEAIRLQEGDRIRLGSKAVLKFACPDPEEENFQRSMFERSVRDTLTGLYNRAFFLEPTRFLALRSASRGLGLAVLMLDIDRFKTINDTFGHDGGDAVLREVAARLRQATRAEDLVARYGGEEFAVALPIASSELAFERGETIRKAILDRRVRFGSESVRVTASVGLSFAPVGGDLSAELLISEADEALYRAKNLGRNRVERAARSAERLASDRAKVLA